MVEHVYRQVSFTMQTQDCDPLTHDEVTRLYAAVQDIGWGLPDKGPQISTGMCAISDQRREEHHKRIADEMALLAKHDTRVREVKKAMKTRRGFVSNSSSTSFVMAVPRESKPKLKLTIEVDLEEFVDHRFNTVDALSAHYIREYGYDDTRLEESDEFVAARQQIERGRDVLFGSLTTESDNPTEVYLANEGMSGIDVPDNVAVISGEGYG